LAWNFNILEIDHVRIDEILSRNGAVAPKDDDQDNSEEQEWLKPSGESNESASLSGDENYGSGVSTNQPRGSE
jgi:hypothetical protein